MPVLARTSGYDRRCFDLVDGAFATDGNGLPDEWIPVPTAGEECVILGDCDLLMAGTVAHAAERTLATVTAMAISAVGHHLNGGTIHRLRRRGGAAALQAETGENQSHDQQRQDGVAGCTGDHADEVDDHGDVLTRTADDVNAYKGRVSSSRAAGMRASWAVQQSSDMQAFLLIGMASRFFLGCQRRLRTIHGPLSISRPC